MEMSKTKLGADHPGRLINMSNLALNWRSMGQHRNALSLMQACSDLRQRVLGPDHPHTISTLRALSIWQMKSKSQEGRTERSADEEV